MFRTLHNRGFESLSLCLYGRNSCTGRERAETEEMSISFARVFCELHPTSLNDDAYLSTCSIYFQVARLGNRGTMSAPPRSSSAGTNAAAMSANATTVNATADANPSPGAEGYEDWIKARAAAVGVPVALEKERQARCVFAWSDK